MHPFNKYFIVITCLVYVVKGFSCLPNEGVFRSSIQSIGIVRNLYQHHLIGQSKYQYNKSHLSSSRLSNTLMDEFSTADGEIINPYKILKVSRSAQRQEIRQAYLRLSKKYHPDAVSQIIKNKGVLPGKCNSIEETRNEWERIKLSYEILSDRKTRLKYDRLDVVTDPGAALRRAALSTVAWGIMGVGKGILSMGGLIIEDTRKA